MRRRSSIKFTISNYIYSFEPAWHLLSRFTLSSRKGVRTVPWGVIIPPSVRNESDTFWKPKQILWTLGVLSWSFMPATHAINWYQINSNNQAYPATNHPTFLSRPTVSAPPVPGASLHAPVFGRRQPQTCLGKKPESPGAGHHAEWCSNQARGGAPSGIVWSLGRTSMDYHHFP